MHSLSKLAGLSLVGLVACQNAGATEGRATPTSEPKASAPVTNVAPAPSAGSLARQKFGAPISETIETSLDDIVQNPAGFKEKTIRTSGTVTAVCQHMGCWMEIGDVEKRAHIKMAGHAFFVPKTASGHHAIVEGKLTGADPLASSCGHEGAESCGGEANGVIAKLEIEATGVEFID
jgi:hypothetical protein